MSGPADKVLAELADRGLLLHQDKTLPCVVGIITGESLSTSWWGHPKAHAIYAVVTELGDHPDVLFTKLLHGKDTLVHRSLWPAVLGVGTAREPWQLRGLSAEAKKLLARIDGGETSVRAKGRPAKEIQLRLLARAHQVHTESGRHETALESWAVWSRRAGCAALSAPGDAAEARGVLQAAAVALGAPLAALPWPR